MILSVIEPAYFPPLSYFAKVIASDVIIWADSFQFKKHSIINRTSIKTVSGPRWLTIPVLSKKRGQQTIKDVQIDKLQSWKQNHLKTCANNYQNAPYYYFFSDELEHILNTEHQLLSSLLYECQSFIFSRLGIQKPVYKSSTLAQYQNRTERIMEWLKCCDCDTYLLSASEQNLVDMDQILDYGFNIIFSDYQQAPYHQQFDGFLDSLSILDLLFNEGEQSYSILKNSTNQVNPKA